MPVHVSSPPFGSPSLNTKRALNCLSRSAAAFGRGGLLSPYLSCISRPGVPGSGISRGKSSEKAPGVAGSRAVCRRRSESWRDRGRPGRGASVPLGDGGAAGARGSLWTPSSHPKAWGRGAGGLQRLHRVWVVGPASKAALVRKEGNAVPPRSAVRAVFAQGFECVKRCVNTG